MTQQTEKALLLAQARAMPTNESLWRDAIRDQLVDASCAVRDLMPEYARQCIARALKMLDESGGDPSRILQILR